jgi:DNA polymerase I
MRTIAFDIEANGLIPHVDTIWCGVGVDLDTEEVFKFTPDRVGEIPDFLDSYGTVVGHNFIGYDVRVLSKILDWSPKCNIIDTWLLSQMASPDRKKHFKTSRHKGPHSLENWGNVVGIDKPDHEEWDRYSEEMLHRCHQDAEITARTFRRLKVETKWDTVDCAFHTAHKIESKFLSIISEMSETGFLVDWELMVAHIHKLDRLMQEIDAEVVPQLPKMIIIEESKKDGEYGWNKKPFKQNGDFSKYTNDWIDYAGIEDPDIIAGPFTRIRYEDFDLGRLGLIKDYLLSQGWVPEKWNTKKDPITGVEHRTSPKISKDEQFMGVKQGVGSKIAERLIYRHRRSNLEGMLKLVRRDDRISAGVTGMTPTVRLKHAGIVNIPGEDAIFGKEMREVFIAKPGYKIVGCDAKSCQLRLLCHHMDDPEYTRSVIEGKKEDGTDSHTLTMKATGIKVRTVAKNFIYGFLFGAGYKKLGLIMGAGSKEGKAAKLKFLKAFPKLANLIEALGENFSTYRYIPGLDGRPIYPRSAHETLCYQLQSDEAVLMKVATIYAYNEIQKRGLDAKLVVHMHDEFQWEAREDQANEVAEILKDSIARAGRWLKLTVPMEGDAAVGNSWWETH